MGLIFSSLALLSACGSNSSTTGAQGAKGDTGAQGIAGPAGPAATPVPTPTESAVQMEVDVENQYRESIGYAPLTAGLTCYLYTVPNTTTSITSAPGLVGIGSWLYTGVFNQPNGSVNSGLNILPTALQGVYQTWYIVKCVGNLVVSDDNWHSFSLNSDDGANLYIDGLLINNDGLHGTQTKTATKYLKYGFHSFEIDYLQGAGSESLIIQEDGAVMQSSGFYH